MDLGFIGLGRMGGNMARHLGAAGHNVAVYDLAPAAIERLKGQPGIKAANSVHELAGASEVVFTSLPGPPEVEAIILDEGGLLGGMKPGSTYVDLSSNAPSLVRSLHAKLAEKGINMVDAPVSGGEEGAIAGTLSVMVGGAKDDFDRLKPLFSSFGSNVFHCGDIGAGSVTKLCNNITSFSIGVALDEALTLGVKAGVDLKILADVIGVSSGASNKLTRKHPNYLFKGNFTPGFMVALAHKDARLALELAEELGVPMTASSYTKAQLDEAMARGWATEDSDAVARLQEERAGVQLRLKM